MKPEVLLEHSWVKQQKFIEIITLTAVNIDFYYICKKNQKQNHLKTRYLAIFVKHIRINVLEKSWNTIIVAISKYYVECFQIFDCLTSPKSRKIINIHIFLKKLSSRQIQ